MCSTSRQIMCMFTHVDINPCQLCVSLCGHMSMWGKLGLTTYHPSQIFFSFITKWQYLLKEERSKLEGGTYILYHKYLNSCICQENRIAFVLQSEVSFSQVQSNESVLLWSLSRKNISALCSLRPLIDSCSSHYYAFFFQVLKSQHL